MPLNHSSTYAELTAEQATLVGRIVVEWSNIEFLLGVMLSRLLFTPEFLGRVYADELNASRIQEGIRKAVDIHRHRYQGRKIGPEVLDEIIRLNKDVERFRGMRNRFSHFCWSRSSDDQIFGSGLSGLVPPSRRLDKDSMILTTRELEAIHREAYELVERLSTTVQALPEITEEQCLS